MVRARCDGCFFVGCFADGVAVVVIGDAQHYACARAMLKVGSHPRHVAVPGAVISEW